LLNKNPNSIPNKDEICPLGITEPFIKLYESIILSKLTKTVEYLNILHPEQLGFRKLLSTRMNIVNLRKIAKKLF
jgi:hypothetical protein